MTRYAHGWILPLALLAIGCGGAPDAASPATGNPAARTADDSHDRFGPLGVGADWERYTKVNATPVMSQDHGKRFVDTYVNDVGLAAYRDPAETAEIPVGSIIVKTAWENEGGQPGRTMGPIFVMEKMAPGYDPDNGDWYYAIHWADPPENMRKRFGGPIYWQSPSSKVGYCVNCHAGYDRQLGMVPEEHRGW